MKRLFAALVLLAITAGICTFEFKLVRDSSTRYINEIKDVEKSFSAGQKDTALTLIHKINIAWKDNVSSMDTLLYHDYVDDISNNFSKLELYIQKDDETAFYITCRELINQLDSLRKSEIPSLENIV